MSRTPIHSALVLGSTSTVARAICQALARQGCRRFHLIARNAVANQALAAELRERFGAVVSLAQALRILAANVGGLIPWLTAIVTPERIQTPGCLWVFSSVAADRGRPSNYHYGAAKAGLTHFCEGLFLRCHGTPFAVRILKAGFMATPMTKDKAPALLCAKPEQIARDLLRRPQRRGLEYIPWWWAPLMLLIRLLPPALAAKL